MNYSKLSVWGTIISTSSKPACLNVLPGSAGGDDLRLGDSDAVTRYWGTYPLFALHTILPFVRERCVCEARGGGCCSMRYESSQIFWSVRCYPRISRWISRSCLLFLLLKMNAEVLYFQFFSSSLWAGSVIHWLGPVPLLLMSVFRVFPSSLSFFGQI